MCRSGAKAAVPFDSGFALFPDRVVLHMDYPSQNECDLVLNMKVYANCQQFSPVWASYNTSFDSYPHMHS